MYHRESYSDRLLEKVEALTSRVQLVKARFAKQTASVKLEHYWELAQVRTLFAEFKWRLEQLGDGDDPHSKRDQEAIETTWNSLMHALDMLLAALPQGHRPQQSPSLPS